jgi:hypothetical protein
MIKNTHRKYILEEKRLPSVTEILGVVSKPYLISWANKMGLHGVDTREYNAELADLGTVVHEKIEAYYHYHSSLFDDSQYSDVVRQKSDELFGKFLGWESERDVHPIFTELPMICSKFGGTIDAVMEIDGKITIIDWKTSREIYPEYFGQLSAYLYLMRRGYPMDGENDQYVYEIGQKIEQVAIVHIPKEGSITSKIITIKSNEFRIAWEFFTACLKLYNAKKEISKLKSPR